MPNQTSRALALLLLLMALVGCNKPEPKPEVATTPKAAPKTAETTPKEAEAPSTAPNLAAIKPVAEEFIRLNNPQKRVAVTFDGGSAADGVYPLLKVLQKHNVKSTFFLTGDFCKHFPKEVKAIADAGMELGNHSMKHPHFPKITKQRILEELEGADAIIQKICGRGTKPLFRFPYGDRDKRTQAIVAEAGYQSFYWSVDALDAVGQRKTAAFMANRLINRLQEGGVSLMHVNFPEAAEAVEKLLTHLEAKGIQAVPASELLIAHQQQQIAKASSTKPALLTNEKAAPKTSPPQ